MDDSNNNPSKEQKMARNSIWVDLFQDILLSIQKKLLLVDQVRFRAVCKNWRMAPKDIIMRRGTRGSLPWLLTRYSWMDSRAITNNRYLFECELFDPYLQIKYTVSTYIESRVNLNSPYNESTRLYASKYEWSLFSVTRNDYSLLFLHNPFTNDVIKLPCLNFICKAATFTTNPTSGDSEILVLCRQKDDQHSLCVAQFCLFTNKEWSVRSFRSMPEEPHKVCYMNGKLFCYFLEGIIKSYNLTNRSWKSVIKTLPNSYNRSRCWLIANKKSLIFLEERFINEKLMWLVFTKDWSGMCPFSRSVASWDSGFCFSGNVLLLATREDGKGKIIMKAFKNMVELVADEERYGCKLKYHFLGVKRQQQYQDDSSRIHGFIEFPYVKS